MKILKTIFDFYINSSIHVALAVYSFVWISLIELHLPYDEICLNFVFFASIVAYNFVKYFGLFRRHYRELTRFLNAILALSVIAFFAMTYYALQLEFEAILLVALLAIITGFYALPFVPKHLIEKGERNLRQIRGIKVYVIAVVWTLTTVILPLMNINTKLDGTVLIISIQRFLLVLVLMLPFELRDLKYDNLKLSTIPQRIGVKHTRWLGYGLLVLLFVLELFKEAPKVHFQVSYLIVVLLTLLLLKFASVDQGKYYSGFWVESIPILWLSLLLVFR